LEKGLMVWDGTAGANEVGTAVLIESAWCSIYMMCLEEESLPQFRPCNKRNWMERNKIDGKHITYFINAEQLKLNDSNFEFYGYRKVTQISFPSVSLSSIYL
jgi:hypothetical protein